jgi:hypothetical protein
VAVLCVDVSGFTSLSERLDPEDVPGLMSRAFELMLADHDPEEARHLLDPVLERMMAAGVVA